MEDNGKTESIRHHVEGIGEMITPRQLRDFINQMPEAALDRPMFLINDGESTESVDADFRNGVLNLF